MDSKSISSEYFQFVVTHHIELIKEVHALRRKMDGYILDIREGSNGDTSALEEVLLGLDTLLIESNNKLISKLSNSLSNSQESQS